jgi:hypothetical protein
VGQRAWIKFLLSEEMDLKANPGLMILKDMETHKAESVMAGFMAAMFAEGKKSSTIKGYSGQARSWIGLKGGPDLRRSAFLAGVWRCVKRLRGQDSKPKMAVTAKFMRAVRAEVDLNTAWGANLWCAALAAYRGLLRSSEYSIKKVNQLPPMRDHAMQIGADEYGEHVELFIGKSKGDQYGVGARTTVGATGGDLCLVQAVKHMRRRFPKQSADEAAFEEAPGQALQYTTMTALLRKVATRLKINLTWVGTHSLRSGGASALSRAGAPPWLIQAIGRWKSDAYKSYVRSSVYGHWTNWAAQALSGKEENKYVHDADHHSQSHKAEVTDDMEYLVKKGLEGKKTGNQ